MKTQRSIFGWTYATIERRLRKRITMGGFTQQYVVIPKNWGNIEFRVKRVPAGFELSNSAGKILYLIINPRKERHHEDNT